MSLTPLFNNLVVPTVAHW